MQGIAINNTKDFYNISLDKKVFNETMISNFLNIIGTEHLAQKINFDEDIFDVSKEIKSSIWTKEKKRIGIEQ